MANESHVEDALLVSVFRLGEGMFAIPAAQIQEVVQMGSVTPVHHAPPCIVGIRNLRGRIVTVMDLGMRLDLDPAKGGAESRIMIVDAAGELVGLLVDRADDTIFLRPDDMSPPPANLGGLQAEALRGVYRWAGGLVTLLDHNIVLNPGEKHAGVPAGSR